MAQVLEYQAKQQASSPAQAPAPSLAPAPEPTPAPPVVVPDVSEQDLVMSGEDQNELSIAASWDGESSLQEETEGLQFRVVKCCSGFVLALKDSSINSQDKTITDKQKNTHALLLFYDVTNKTSFDNIQAWLTEIYEYAQQDVVLMLLGNKADATHERVVKREEGEKLAKEFGVPFMETSAKTGMNVELAFMAIAKELKHRSMKMPNEAGFKLHEYVNKEMKSSGCCKS
ncbi:UNVERIFIED_CONTAM: hypothetical protein FKN15_039609 [Acipenser sinensis]